MWILGLRLNMVTTFYIWRGIIIFIPQKINVGWKVKHKKATAVSFSFKGNNGRTKNMAVLYNTNQTNQSSFTRCFSLLWVEGSQYWPLQCAKGHKFVIRSLLWLCVVTSGDLVERLLSVATTVRVWTSGYFTRLLNKTERALDQCSWWG
jgi:hypothetical protein